MPGYLLYDFGDAARTLLNPLPESAPNWEQIRVDLNMFRAFVSGWGESGLKQKGRNCGGSPTGGPDAYLHGIRALADYLTGDQYYQTAYPGQNLVRAKNLLGFADKARKALPEMQGILREIAG